jgi:hypothetical protein
MKSTARNLIRFVVVFGLLACVLGLLHRAGSRSTLDRYRAELRARGEKLSVVEIAVPPSTNATHLAARQMLATTSYSASPGLLVNLMTYVAPGKARLASQGELDLVPLTMRSNAPSSTWEAFIAQVAKSELSLETVRGALENPPPDNGWVWQDTYQSVTNWPGRTFVRDRAFCQMLYNAAIADLHQDKLDAAIANLDALAGFAQMNRNEIVIVSQMIRVAIAGAGLSATWEALQAPGWDEPRLATLQRTWEREEFLEGVERSFAGERAIGEMIMSKVRNSSIRESVAFLTYLRGGTKSSWSASGKSLRDAWQAAWEDHLVPLGYRLTSLNEDELFQLQFSTRQMEVIRLLKHQRPWPEVLAVQTNLVQEVTERFSQDHLGRLRVSAVTIPSLKNALLSEVKTDTQRKLTITAIAIKRHQLKHGVPPANLAVLVPEFLTTVPVDPMSGKPLCYRLNMDASFVLYSTGEDGKDDGGDPTPANGGGKFGLWEGRDAVWPSAATPEEQAAAVVAANAGR